MASDEEGGSGDDTSSSSAASNVEVAVLARGRRATAGRRLTTLTGQAAEDDDVFWGHDTWGEDGEDSDNASFRESDEESEQRVDTFDSDFDDDEDDEVDAEKEKAAQAEAEIARQERQDRQKKRGVHKAEPKKRTTMRKIVGQGLNAGIVLNAPGQIPLPAVGFTGTTAAAAAAAAAAAVRPAKPVGATSIPTFATVAATRKPRRSTQQSKYSSRFRSARQGSDQEGSQTSSGVKRKLTAAERAGDKKKPKRFKQEDLLVEAINQTEPNNRRWLLQRQRIQSERDEAHQQAMDRKSQSSGKLIERFSSRRGALNLVHFPASEYVPEILKGRSKSNPTKPQPPPKCVITGRPARYRDPKTGLPYYNAAAFQELKRCHGNRKPPPPAAAAKASAATTTKTSISLPTTLPQSTGAKAASILPTLNVIVPPIDPVAVAAAAALTLESTSISQQSQPSGGKPTSTKRRTTTKKSLATKKRKAPEKTAKGTTKMQKPTSLANGGKSQSTTEKSGANGKAVPTVDNTVTPTTTSSSTTMSTTPLANQSSSSQSLDQTKVPQPEPSSNKAAVATPSTGKRTSGRTKKPSTKVLEQSPQQPA